MRIEKQKKKLRILIQIKNVIYATREWIFIFIFICVFLVIKFRVVFPPVWRRSSDFFRLLRLSERSANDHRILIEFSAFLFGDWEKIVRKFSFFIFILVGGEGSGVWDFFFYFEYFFWRLVKITTVIKSKKKKNRYIL